MSELIQKDQNCPSIFNPLKEQPYSKEALLTHFKQAVKGETNPTLARILATLVTLWDSQVAETERTLFRWIKGPKLGSGINCKMGVYTETLDSVPYEILNLELQYNISFQPDGVSETIDLLVSDNYRSILTDEPVMGVSELQESLVRFAEKANEESRFFDLESPIVEIATPLMADYGRVRGHPYYYSRVNVHGAFSVNLREALLHEGRVAIHQFSVIDLKSALKS